MPHTQDKPLVACIGEAMVELSFPNSQTTANIGYAGDTLNTAVYLKRGLKESRNVAFVSAVGNDTFSNNLINFVDQQDLDTRWIQQLEDKMPGLYSITTDTHGERTFNYWRDTSAAKEIFRENPADLLDILGHCRLIYFSGISLAILNPETRAMFLDWLTQYKAQPDTLVAFDSNYRPKLWANPGEARNTLVKAWSLADIALPSLDDEQLLFDDQTAEDTRLRMLDYGVTSGAVKRGMAGPLAIPDDLDVSFSAAEKVVDTTAAGDSFNGAYLASVLNGESQSAALLAGHQCAKTVIGTAGAIIPISR